MLPHDDLRSAQGVFSSLFPGQGIPGMPLSYSPVVSLDLVHEDAESAPYASTALWNERLPSLICLAAPYSSQFATRSCSGH
jgi:hypothetical protein